MYGATIRFIRTFRCNVSAFCILRTEIFDWHNKDYFADSFTLLVAIRKTEFILYEAETKFYIHFNSDDFLSSVV